jgi:formate dehydrogenase maturation protein FdhE
LLAAWLADEELVAAEAYLARATLRGPLEALGPPDSGGTGQAHRCARSGGPAQLSLRGVCGDRLVNGSRHLECARCLHRWPFTSGACAGCGALRGAKRTVHSEPRTTTVGRRQGDDAVFPHLRMESCGTCRRYLLDVDLGVEPRAVPEVDEIAALPFGLYAARRGLSKITPNLLGY